MMKMRFFLTFLIVSSSMVIVAQCPPSIATTTITGFYTLDIVPSQSTTVYIAPNATVTGNIDLFNCSLYNCGIILSKKAKMKQSNSNSQYVLKNNNYMNCDSILIDTLGHLHNADTLICKRRLDMKLNSDVTNNFLMDIGTMNVKSSHLSSSGTIKVDYFDISGSGSWLYDIYGTISVRKLFRVNADASVYGVVFICVDSCFINSGSIGSSTASTWSPNIRVNGLSQITGTISGLDFCDLSSSNGGMPDVNSGNLNNITYCTSSQFYCDFGYTSLKEVANDLRPLNVYPNPVVDKFRINSGDAIVSKLELLDVLGKKILEIFDPGPNPEINISNLTKGIYYVSVRNQVGTIKIQKLIKE